MFIFQTFVLISHTTPPLPRKKVMKKTLVCKNDDIHEGSEIVLTRINFFSATFLYVCVRNLKMASPVKCWTCLILIMIFHHEFPA